MADYAKWQEGSEEVRQANTGLKQSLLEAARQEFQKNGYRHASVRSIAKAAGVTTGALYRYFPCKEDLFEALVGEPAKRVYDYCRQVHESFSAQELQEQLSSLTDIESQGVEQVLSYVYDDYDAFRLIASCAEGSPYETYLEKLIQLETESSQALIQGIQGSELGCRDLDLNLVHIISSTYFTGLFEIIAHDESRDQAMAHIGQLKDFYMAGWFRLLDVPLGQVMDRGSPKRIVI